MRGDPVVEHPSRQEVHGRHREQTQQSKRKPRGERAHAEELEGSGGDVDGQPGSLPPDVVLVVVLTALLGDEARAVPGERNAEPEDTLGQQRRLRLVVPQIALPEAGEDEKGTEDNAQRHQGADAGLPGHQAFRSKTATHTGESGV